MDSSNYVYIQQTENTGLFGCVAVFKTQTQVGQHKRVWYLSHWRAAMIFTSFSIRAAPPEPSLLLFTKYGTKVSQHKRFWYLSHWRAAMALTSLSMCAAPPEPSLLAFTKYGTKVSQHKRFWSLIALMSSDDLYEPKHLHSFASVFAFCIHKVW